MATAESGAAPRRRTYDALLQDIEADLRSGKIKLGDRLPGERSLAETYGISRASVREAIRILDAMGVLRSSVGSGPTSGAIVISDPSAGLSSALRLHVASNRLPVADIVQTRILLETWAAETAAAAGAAGTQADGTEAAGTQAAGTELEQAARLLEAMDEPDLDRDTFHELDARFHVALSSLAGNTVIATMMESLSGSIVGYVKDAVDTLEGWPAVLDVLRQQHHGIFDAVQARDGALAARLLREHIEWFYRQAKDASADHATH